MIICEQRWNFIFDRPLNGIRANKSAQLLINTVTGIIRPFTVLDSSIDEDDQITYRLIPDEGYQDDPDLESELMIENINGSLTKFAIIVEEVNV
jgi:hypothetical protein